MSYEPSPRPWHEDNYCIYDANGKIVAGISSTTDNADALLIVAAVNEYSPIPKSELLADAVSENIALRDERDRLRDIVRRLADALGEANDSCHFDDGPDVDLVREARAALGEEEK